MNTSRCLLAAALAVAGTLTFAPSVAAVPDVSQLHAGITTYGQVVAAYGQPMSIQPRRDGSEIAVYTGAANAVATHVEHAVARRAIRSIGNHLFGAIASRVGFGSIASDAAYSAVTQASNAANAAVNRSTAGRAAECDLTFDAQGVYEYGRCTG